MKLISLTQGKFAIVDDSDYDLASKFKWNATKIGNTFYAVSYVVKKRTMTYLHRFIMNPPLGMLVDHANHNGLDCQRNNLRICTKQENVRNRRGPTKASASGARGVWRHRDKWGARIKVDGRSLYLGVFNLKEDAIAAYASANCKYFGAFGGGL